VQEDYKLTEINEELIQSGTWLYDSMVEHEVHLIKTNFKPGSGDREDDPEVKDDQFGIYYGIQIGSYTGAETFVGASFITIKEAKEYASKICPSLKWNDDE